jgi:Na+/H+-dicarboxylate symporter
MWMKYLLGMILGIAAAFILPVNTPQVAETLGFLSRLTIRIGRYVLIPLIFFSITAAVYSLHDAKQLYKPLGIMLLTIILSSLFLTFVGLFSILIIKSPRISISSDAVTGIASLDIQQLIESLFPYSGFVALLNESFLLPTFLLAFFIGSACALDKSNAKPLLAPIAALVKIFEYIAGFIMDFLAIGIIAVVCMWTVEFFGVITSGVFNTLFLVLAVDFVLVICVLYPLFMSFFCRDSRPFRVLYTSIAPVIAAFFSGDTHFTLPITMKQSREDLGIPGSISAVSFPLFSAFARGGAALTSAVSFVIILHSYSSLEISFETILWITGSVFCFSFLLPGLPSGGAFVLLTVLCTWYGRGFEAGYLLLKPAAPILCSFSAAIDTATAIFGTSIVAAKVRPAKG